MNHDNKVSLERMLMSNCIKYGILADLSIEAFKGSKAKMINIYIDTYSILKSMYSDIDILYGKYNMITSCLINIVIHYKYFFVSRYNIPANVYIINSNNICPINKRYVSGYNYTHEQKVVSNTITTDIINKNRPMLQKLVPYLPGIYYIETDFESGVIMYDLMLRDINDEYGHLVITKDPYNYQLATARNESIVIKNKRDESRYISKYNLYKEHAIHKSIKTVSDKLSPELYTLILALNNLPERNIKSIYSINKIVNSLERAVLNNTILNQYNSDINYICNVLRNDGIEINEAEIGNRFKAIDIPTQHMIFYSSPEKDLLELSLVDKVDPDTVRHINNTEFDTNPLNLNNI